VCVSAAVLLEGVGVLDILQVIGCLDVSNRTWPHGRERERERESVCERETAGFHFTPKYKVVPVYIYICIYIYMDNPREGLITP
jgi:hypothetical protein